MRSVAADYTAMTVRLFDSTGAIPRAEKSGSGTRLEPLSQEPNRPGENAPQSRPFQFRLPTFMIAITIAAILLGLWVWTGTDGFTHDEFTIVLWFLVAAPSLFVLLLVLIHRARRGDNKGLG
jgi:hypothetical protein